MPSSIVFNSKKIAQVEELDPRKDEERRSLLREVEVRVMQYQDELESGRKTVKAGWTVAEQVNWRREITY